MAEEKKAPRARATLPNLLKHKWIILSVYFLAVVILSTVVWLRILNPLYPWQRSAEPQPTAPAATQPVTIPVTSQPAKPPTPTVAEQGKSTPQAQPAAPVAPTPASQPETKSSPAPTGAQSTPPATEPKAAAPAANSIPPEEVLPVAIVYQDPDPSDTEMIWPVSPVNIIVRHGRQYSNTMEDWRFHQGVDVKVAENTLVRAALNGKVVSTYTDAQLGEVIILEHANGLKTKYGNLVSSKLEMGKAVQRGETIGKVGLTARYETADGPHLHFEVLREDASVNPQEILQLN